MYKAEHLSTLNIFPQPQKCLEQVLLCSLSLLHLHKHSLSHKYRSRLSHEENKLSRMVYLPRQLRRKKCFFKLSHIQCDLGGGFLKVLGETFSCKNAPNILQIFGTNLKCVSFYQQNRLRYFLVNYCKNWATFNSNSLSHLAHLPGRKWLEEWLPFTVEISGSNPISCHCLLDSSNILSM